MSITTTTLTDDELRLSMIARLRTNPMLGRYINRIKKSPGKSLADNEPWMAVAQKLLAVMCVLNFNMPPRLRGIDEPTLAVQTAKELLKSQAYLWTPHAESEARSAGFPRCVIASDIMQYDKMFICFQGSIGFGTGMEIGWQLVIRRPLGFEVMWIAMPTVFGVSPQVGALHVLFGSTFPDDYQADEAKACETVLRRLAFVNSPYIEIKQHKISKSIRRDALRENAGQKCDLLDDSIGVVILRQPKKSPSAARTAEASSEWQHHWWVRGHYRAQWMPSLKAHKVIWVGAHLKGNLEKPLLEKVYAVVR